MIRTVLISIVLLLCCHSFVSAQAKTGTFVLNAFPSINGKREKLTRKRFYLFSGGLAENKALIDRTRTAEIKTRDCYYKEQKASPEFICWLQVEDCESPFCRKPTKADAETVPEFKAAFQSASRVKNTAVAPSIALDWLISYLPPVLSSGFYDERKTLTETLLGGVKPVQSSMSTAAGKIQATFIDVPFTASENKKTQTFLVTNLVPIENGGKSFVWACQVEIGAETSILNLPDPAKAPKSCIVTVRELKHCSEAACKGT